jgi:hypothetical protein
MQPLGVMQSGHSGLPRGSRRLRVRADRNELDREPETWEDGCQNTSFLESPGFCD